ncbi:MAG: LysM domain-containing protein [Acidimicrobiia bacterium]
MRKVVVLTIVTIAFGAALAACGGSGSGSSSASTSLTITTRTGSESVLVPSEATLECGATPKATGFLADAAEPACAAVADGAVTKVKQSQKSGRLCSQIFGGPQTAHITGTIDDKDVNLRVDRTDGCGVEDWTALEAVLGAPDRTGDVPKASTATTVAADTATETTAPTTYTVQRGDTLTSIAAQFRVRVSELRAANPQLSDPDNLVEGEVLTVPLASRPVLTVTAPPDEPFQLQFSFTGAQPGEQVVFIVATPQGSFTGPAHIVDNTGTVTATYDAGGLAGDYVVLAKGAQGSVDRAEFHINAPGT